MRSIRRSRHGHAEVHTRQSRRRVAMGAARLIVEHGISDYHLAKRKAAQRLGVSGEGCLPRNREIEQALREYQRLFRATQQPRVLRERREVARAAMQLLARFEPRLVGAVLDGTADLHSPVYLHVFHDCHETVTGFLRERGIAFEQRARMFRLDPARNASFPVLRFDANGVAVDLTVFPHDALRQAPIDYITARPQQRASLAALDALLAQAQDQETMESAAGCR